MKRKNFIDIAKGIGIILVILGHLDYKVQISRHFIYSFHMPLFLFISGMFNHSQNINFKTHLKKNFKSLLLPFWSFCTIDLLIHLFLYFVDGKPLHENYLLGFIGINYHISNVPIWFLFSLFLIRTLYYFLSKKTIYKIMAILVGLIPMILSYFYTLPDDNLLISTLPCMIFYILGDMSKDYVFKLEKSINKKKILSGIITVLLFVALLTTSNLNGIIDLSHCEYYNVPLLLINAFLGIALTLCFSILIQNNKPLSKPLIYYGQNTMIIIPLHYYICRFILPVIMDSLYLGAYLYHPITQIVVCLILLLVFIPTIKFCHIYFPTLFGIPKKLKEKASN